MTWGSPYGDGGAGWGSPYGDGEPGWGAPYGVATTIATPGSFLSDEGGEVITLYGDWAPGVYKAYFRDTDEVVWPESGYGCFALVAGQVDEIFIATTGAPFRFGTPPLPVGEYVVDVRDGGGQLVATTTPLLVMRRDRAWPQQYELAESMPERWVAGDRSALIEPFATDDNRPPFTPLRALIAAFGRTLYRFTAPPCTRLTSDYEPGDTAIDVETPFRFLGARTVWAGGIRAAIIVDPEAYTMTFDSNGPPARLPATSLVVRANDAHPSLLLEPGWVDVYSGATQGQDLEAEPTLEG